MDGDLAALKKMSEELVVPRPEFAVTDEVWGGVRSWETEIDLTGNLDNTANQVCGMCRQVIRVLWNDKGIYRYTTAQADGLKLAHLFQAHGWTRETIGEC